MRYFTLFLAFILLFTLAAVSFYLFAIGPEWADALGALIPRLFSDAWGRAALAAAGLVSLGCSLSLASLLLGIEPAARRQIFLKNETGSIGVSLDAIEEFIKRRGETVRGVRDLSVKAEIQDGGLVIRNRVVLELQRNVPEFTNEFQGVVHRELTDTLGLNNVKEVRVLIHKIFPREPLKEPKLLTGPQQVVLKPENERGGDDETRNGGHKEEAVTYITPREDRGKGEST